MAPEWLGPHVRPIAARYPCLFRELADPWFLPHHRIFRPDPPENGGGSQPARKTAWGVSTMSLGMPSSSRGCPPRPASYLHRSLFAPTNLGVFCSKKDRFVRCSQYIDFRMVGDGVGGFDDGAWDAARLARGWFRAPIWRVGILQLTVRAGLT